MLRLIWLLLTIAVPIASQAAVHSVAGSTASLEQRERRLHEPFLRDSQLTSLSRINARMNCEDVQPPEALTTPNPLWIPARERARVKVSFIIGTDGRVHSPLILQSAGASGDHRVLQTIRNWRFRPATCNGVPTEMESKVGFSTR
ncbi:MAG TPA: TonB family protein [Candidatus Sulfotelmatobacter sp.]|nr:TonB family protein [Candidatus Sulfotelmatobacter sp.]